MELSKEKIDELEKELQKTKEDYNILKKAIWDILNYTSLFFVLLDKQMKVKLSNWYLATTLGFKDEKEIMGRCWLDFIPIKDYKYIENIHKILSHTKDDNVKKKYKEVINDMLLPDNNIITVRWFNFPINSKYNMTLSVGVKLQGVHDETEDSIRSYYRDIIEKDRTMIMALRETFIDISEKNKEIISTCTPNF